MTFVSSDSMNVCGDTSLIYLRLGLLVISGRYVYLPLF